MDNLISIIVPIYNVEAYVDKCIKSIIEQTYRNIEIILVDDGSTDASGKICDKYSQIDKRIMVLHTKNYGVTHARKKGIELAKGIFAGFVDGDDYIDKNYYELLINKMKSGKYDFVQMGIIYEYPDGKSDILTLREQEHDIRGIQADIICEGLLGARKKIDLAVCSLWSRLFKMNLMRECLLSIPDYLVYGEDMVCMCKYLLRSKNYAVLENAGYHYVQRSSSATNIKSMNFIINYCKLYEYIVRMFSDTSDNQKVKSLMKKAFIRDVSDRWEVITGQPIAQYEFPHIHMLFGKKIIIYGAGKIGRDYYEQICKYQQCKVVALADTYYEKYNYEYINVIGPQYIEKLEWNILVISVLQEKTANQIKYYLTNMGIAEDKIYWCKPRSLYEIR